MNNKEIWKLGFFIIGIGLIFLSGYYFHAVQGDYNRQCNVGDFDDWVAMENDFTCGDFGVYWFKFMILLAILGSGIGLTIFQLPYMQGGRK